MSALPPLVMEATRPHSVTVALDCEESLCEGSGKAGTSTVPSAMSKRQVKKMGRDAARKDTRNHPVLVGHASRFATRCSFNSQASAGLPLA